MIAVWVGASLTGCASHGTRPHDMSASEHQRAASEALARDHAKLAAAHARAANALLEAERRACSGVPPGAAPDFSALQVVRLSVLERPIKGHDVVEGAAVLIRTGGRSFESVSQLVACRSAHAAVTRDPADPFAVIGASARALRDDGDVVIVQIRSADPARAAEIVRRSKRLWPAEASDDAPSWEAEEPDGSRDPTR